MVYKRRRMRRKRKYYRYRRRNRLIDWNNKGYLTKQMPDRLFVKLTYYEIFTETNASTGTFTIIYAGNGMYDPYPPTGGHQPRSFDQYISLYYSYCVLASKITVTVVNRMNTSLEVSVGPMQTQTVLSAYSPESKYVKSKLLGGINTSSGSTGVITNYASTKRVFGIKDVLGEAGLCGNAGNNPTDMWYWSVAVAPVTAEAHEFDYSIKIDYYAVFFSMLGDAVAPS